MLGIDTQVVTQENLQAHVPVISAIHHNRIQTLIPQAALALHRPCFAVVKTETENR